VLGQAARRSSADAIESADRHALTRRAATSFGIAVGIVADRKWRPLGRPGLREARMTSTAAIAAQPLLALARANEIRRARAQLKRRIAAGQLSAAEVILDCPQEASNWPVAELLASQPHWGSAKCSKFLARNRISEIKAIAELTERQQRLLAAQLKQRSQARSELVRPGG
jgi:hypothetical protein